jgi:hypothetical protein
VTCTGCPEGQPFYVGDSPRFRGAKSGYLPSLCRGCPDEPREKERVLESKTVFVERVTDGQFLRLKAIVDTLQDRVNRLTNRKRTSKYD